MAEIGPVSITLRCACCDRVVCATEPPNPAPKLASFMEAGHTLTDADVERVARRVVEMLAEKLKR